MFYKEALRSGVHVVCGQSVTRNMRLHDPLHRAMSIFMELGPDGRTPRVVKGEEVAGCNDSTISNTINGKKIHANHACRSSSLTFHHDQVLLALLLNASPLPADLLELPNARSLQRSARGGAQRAEDERHDCIAEATATIICFLLTAYHSLS